ncbi:hypothetical protein [Pseudocitrobacter vendiensis]|uniref:DUF551 domain-containing protein n=1 Tax=Pseudocitrobacter vendiensis TaxID=2488306 RepID=A0ABM9F5I9_9ENTR|nr:hypothetical protein [Pseudocitrobacter vendiensis]CAH6636035.1 DUF551 domain-containing protein [Pseudocitrobacter vendiensis]
MSNIDKHAVQAVADLKAGYTLGNADVAILNELARIALASLEAEPAIHSWRRVTVEPYGPYPWHYGNFIGFSKPVEGIEDEYFYSAPSAPVVPQEATPEDIAILASTFAPRGVTYQWDSDECNAAADSWNACRTAMLQVGNSPAIPDGYVLVPKIVTPEISKAINEVGNRCTCGNCSQRLWDLLLAAAPRQEGI